MPIGEADRTGSGGSKDSGPMADKFFDPKHREDVLDLYVDLNDYERSCLKDILGRFHCIIRIANCTEKINDLDELDNYCKETYFKLVELFPWMNISDSVHKLLGHLPQVIAANGGKGLGNLSEVR